MNIPSSVPSEPPSVWLPVTATVAIKFFAVTSSSTSLYRPSGIAASNVVCAPRLPISNSGWRTVVSEGVE